MPQPMRIPDQREKLGAVAQFDNPPFGSAFLAHTAPARACIAPPGKLALICAHLQVRIDVAQFMCNAAFKDTAGRPPQAVVDANEMAIGINRIVQQPALRVPGNRNWPPAKIGEGSADQIA